MNRMLKHFRTDIFYNKSYEISKSYYNPIKAFKRDFNKKILSDPVIVYMTIMGTIFAFTGVIQMILAIISLKLQITTS